MSANVSFAGMAHQPGRQVLTERTGSVGMLGLCRCPGDIHGGPDRGESKEESPDGEVDGQVLHWDRPFTHRRGFRVSVWRG